MTPVRPGRSRPIDRGLRSRVSPAGCVLISLLAFTIAACGTPVPSASVASSTAPATTAPGQTETTSGSATPSIPPTTVPVETPSSEITPPPGSESPGPSATGSGDPSAACFGSQQTQGFFSDFAQAVPWPVYCVVLPAGWSVEPGSGSYHLANGGRLTIAYHRRSDGARLVLYEGAWCTDGTGCVPDGTDAGSTPFGDRQADLETVNAGGFAASVDRGDNPTWLLTGTSIQRAEFIQIAADLLPIDE